MAKILLGATIGDARGSAGAIVYSKNRSGAYIRQKVSPVQPRTARQTLVRAQLSYLSIRWGGTLTDAQRAAWNALAATAPVTDVFGNSQVLTGAQMYVRVNRNLQSVGAAVIDTAPANQASTPLASLSVAADSVGQTIAATFTPAPVPADHSLIVYASPAMSPGKTFFKPLLKFVIALPTPTASPAAFPGAYIAIFGAIPLGQRIGIRAALVNTLNGAVGSFVYANAVAS